MAIGDQKAGLIFKISADSRDAIRDLGLVDSRIDQLGSNITSAFAPAAGVIAGTGAAMAAIGVAALAVTRQVYDLTKSTADFGSEIFDASQKTGLSAERISAIKFAADQSGASLEQFTGGAARFARTIGEAGNGSEKAQAKLDRLGVTSRDLDTALKQALATIAKMPPGTDQMTAAIDAFGKSGADLIPFIRSFDGDLEALTEKARELGVTMDDEAARAADEFGDQLDTLGEQFAGLGRQIGITFMPIFMDMASGMSNFFAANQEEINTWFSNLRLALQGVAGYAEDARQAHERLRGEFEKQPSVVQNMAANIAGSLIPAYFKLIYYAGQYTAELLKQRGLQQPLTGQAGGVISPAIGEPPDLPGTRTGGTRSPRAARDDSASKAEQLAKRDLNAAIQLEKKNLDTIQEQLDAAFDRIERTFKENGIVGFMLQDSSEAVQTYQRAVIASLELLEELENRGRDAMTEHERAVLTATQLERREKAREEVNKRIRGLKQETLKQEEEAYQRQGDVLIELNEKEHQRLKLLEEQTKEIEEQRAKERERFQLDPGKAPESGGFWGDLDEMTGQITGLGDVMKQLGDVAGQVFMQFGEGLGMMVENWVLMGDAADVSMKKMLATILAGVAKQAATLAIFHTAMGIAALTPWGAAIYGSAANHFAAAAIWAGVAAAAGGVGRAVAGDSFKSGTGSARGGSRSPSDLDRDQDNDLSGFGGFGNPRGRQGQEIRTPMAQQVAEWLGPHLDRQNQINGAVVEAVNTFTGKFGTAPPDHVVVAGSQTARGSQAVAVANQKAHSQGGRTSEKFYRNSGQVR
jgi:hypothetical protein